MSEIERITIAELRAKINKLEDEIECCYKAQLNEQELELKDLKSLCKKLIEYVDDCSVSHNETRYKYRAQVLSKDELYQQLLRGEG